MTIRFAQIYDFDYILKIERNVFDFPWSAYLLKQSLLNDKCVVLIFEGKVVAYLIWQQIFDEVNILNVAVDLKYQNKGFCKNLIKFLTNLSFECKFNKIFLEVRQTNIIAFNVYLKQGFKVIGKRLNYYDTLNGSKENAILMLKDLDF